ncbi:MAG: 2-(1,2-epoxy-1,2-dihydrophenyl)acetyl-CoA isomerase [Rhodospirillaceae bacterium]|jgi:2-(1,2-epoxy-1,2-dihydrophenyl)acetyl-CoA isomerase|nr:2-(1,2-epoxy-1,2-dihydrophenyl)acetyl-CoA isomerase [Rhodospirillaceae bacterium]MBT3492357.1 2-(1,2-epoxy-1,2-dihydrophenyl)acetyl-CoA isomerase [Rhodospirillaceae bacterium]MBT3780011.1 2-(1,2-epoxy-1,2-dihydrophenyl)acetyl-CoA isomerase [Rhodospirillaceae bacterium]MBT3978677.1 2-(1,2-epoxy-1,2-dihydrophenyl)acetyl-CoA isomerase [Rhodospirillaceae bacterium]MBT4168449.1 2-(1,2-epoxy-1,2-dihydrophenyl)acetyl-CoA isomerase [Rhodospirillaceae bacterium]
MSDPQILFDVSDHIATITLNRPEAMNALAGDMREVILGHLETCAAVPDVRCIVITGAGRAFCAGGDIAAMAAKQDIGDISEMGGTLVTVEAVVTLLRGIPKPVIAAVNGAAAGGGMNMALACDIRLGCEKTLFSESFVKIGLIPDWAGFGSLTELVGAAKAMELMMTGERIRAEEAHRLGLLNQLYPMDTFRDDVQAFAKTLASGPPQALAAIKRGVYAAANASLAEVLAFERKNQLELILSDDSREGMRAFLEKRAPKFGSS